jgi:hypothetical protein
MNNNKTQYKLVPLADNIERNKIDILENETKVIEVNNKPPNGFHKATEDENKK